MKVFISSVIDGFAEFRDAAIDAVTSLGHTVKRTEDNPAAPHSARQACLSGVRDADVTVTLLGSSNRASNKTAKNAGNA